MKVMFDSGAAHSFIRKTALKRTTHSPITFNCQRYVMADGYTTFEILGTVKITIEINHIRTSIVANVVNSLCVDCILGMDYMNKYQVNINNKEKQIQIHTHDDTAIIFMNKTVNDINVLCRLNNHIHIQPYQEKKIKINLQVSSGQMLFFPAHYIIYKKGLISPTSLISVHNHVAYTTIYNSTDKSCYLNKNAIIGTASSYSSFNYVSTIFDSKTKETIDKNTTQIMSSVSEKNINQALTHVQDQPQLNELKSILIKHHSLFDTSTTTIAQTPISHVICTRNNPPTTSKPYPQTFEKQKATLDIVQQMLKHKQIRASHSQYSAPVLLIKKKDGSYRFIVDYRKLNDITIPDNFPLPNLEQSLQVAGGHHYYTKLDLRAGYFQIPISEQDKHKTAFITTHGLYEFNVLAQGLKNSPPSFQRVMSNLLLPCQAFTLVYLDDVLIYSNSFNEHLQHVNQVLAILNKHQFQLKPEKCEFFRTSIDYLGHTINVHGIKPLQERINKILNIPQPTSLNEANAFIGGVGWYRKFVKDYTKLVAPILAVTNLTKPNKHKFIWDTPQREAFDKLKLALISEPLFLNYPDPNAPLVLATDASDTCIGGVLYQEIDGERKNIYFHSQMLPKVQRKWPTIEKEALAIYYCVTRMKSYLLGHEFIIQTDHCPLRDMHKKPSNNRRVDRISLILQQYNIKEIRHIAGKCNCMADYLTRYPRQLEDDDEFIPSDFGDIPAIQYPSADSKLNNCVTTIFHMTNAVTTRAQAKAQIQATTSNNPDTSTEETISLNDQPHLEEGHEFDITIIAEAQKADKLYQEKVREIENNPQKSSYTLENEILYKIIKHGIFTQKLLYVPSSLLTQLLDAYHKTPWAGHFGSRRTYFKLKDKYWWPEMHSTIKNYIRNCLKCQKYNIDRRKPPGLLHPIKPPPGPFQMIGIDYSGPFPITPQGNKYVLAITDYFTKWIVAIPLPNQTAQTTAEALYEHYICIYGVPSVILSDQGTHFHNQLMTAFTQLLGCHHIKSITYHPQTNGVIERFNSTFERQLAKLTDQRINDWDIHLKSVIFAYNTGQHTATKFSPYQLQFGQHPKLPPDEPIMQLQLLKPNDYLHHLQKTLSLYHQQAKNNILKSQKYYKHHYDRNRADIRYNIGDLVLKRIPNNSSKLSSLYSNPMKIVKHDHPIYWIQDPNDDKIIQVHISQLRTCNSNYIH